MKKVFAIFILFVSSFSYLNADDISLEAADEPHTQEKALYPALLGGLFVNSVFHLTARTFGADFAQVTFDSIRTNLNSTWVWDNDHFLFNHPGHPYQGGLYHVAARSNGFTFYESIFFNALGSISWELFGETDLPSMNDFFITVYGGLAVGEIMHRLYLEADFPLAFLISPMDALNNLIFGRQPARTNNLHHLSAFTGAAWIRSNKLPGTQFFNYEGARITDELFTSNIGFDIIYGDPYIQSSRVPFNHFEMKFQFGGALLSQLWLDWTVLIDGYLFSFNLLDTERTVLSNGLTLHYDLITGSNTNFASNSLAYSLKWRYNFTNTQISSRFHLGCILFGSSRYYPDAYIEESIINLGDDNNNYGSGANTKLQLSVSNNVLGDFRLLLFSNFLYFFRGRNQEVEGWVLFNLFQFEYWYNLNDRVSLGLNNSLYLKSGRYGNNPDIIEAANRISIYVKRTFVNRGN